MTLYEIAVQLAVSSRLHLLVPTLACLAISNNAAILVMLKRQM